jgi:hypothetical protein
LDCRNAGEPGSIDAETARLAATDQGHNLQAISVGKNVPLVFGTGDEHLVALDGEIPARESELIEQDGNGRRLGNLTRFAVHEDLHGGNIPSGGQQPATSGQQIRDQRVATIIGQTFWITSRRGCFRDRCGC